MPGINRQILVKCYKSNGRLTWNVNPMKRRKDRRSKIKTRVRHGGQTRDLGFDGIIVTTLG